MKDWDRLNLWLFHFKINPVELAKRRGLKSVSYYYQLKAGERVKQRKKTIEDQARVLGLSYEQYLSGPQPLTENKSIVKPVDAGNNNRAQLLGEIVILLSSMNNSQLGKLQKLIKTVSNNYDHF
jgi:hypothetical protein